MPHSSRRACFLAVFCTERPVQLRARMAKGDDLKIRTRAFALAVMQFCGNLPRTMAGQRLGGQLFNAGTSVAANYRAACRSRSRADFIAKLRIVIEEP